MNQKPRIFIGSSAEILDIADAINLNLDHQAEVTIWRNNTFDLSSNTIDSLINKAKSVDFSLFIFSPTDITLIRNQQKATVRDNVIFELGLFIGTLGKERCFILKPRNTELHFPTDLLGITPADYDANRSDNDLASAVNHACVLIKNMMAKLKTLDLTTPPPSPRKNSIDVGSELKSNDYRVLAQLIGTATEDPAGYTLSQIKHALLNKSPAIDISVIRLEQLGYIDRRNESDMNGNEYFCYRITSEGIELLLANEEKALVNISTQPQPIYDSFDDDIPF